MDPIVQFKENQKAAWAGFAAMEALTGAVAPKLVKFARVAKGARVLDVGSGTGVVALTAARTGANVTGLDLTPELVAHANENAALMKVEASFQQGDVEALPFGDATFDVVLSQFGHMFAPRPDVATKEMLRVLKPGGTIAFSTWPPELFVGRSFSLMASYAPAPPPGVTPPATWGDPGFVRERLGSLVKELTFARDVMWLPALSPAHYRSFFERWFGPAQKLLAALDASDKAGAASFRRDYEALAGEYFDENRVRQDFLMSRAIKG